MGIKNIKKTLAASVIVLVLCVAIFAGTTYAWFSDSISNKGNVITSGTLRITARAYNESTGGGVDYDSVIDMNNSTEPIINDTNFKPGDENSKLLVITNAGSIDAKIVIGFAIGEEKELIGALWYALSDTDENFAKPATDIPKSSMSAIELANNEHIVAPNSSIYIRLDYGMYSSAGNSYGGLSFELTAFIFAEQVISGTSGSTIVRVASAEGLGSVDAGKTAILTRDIQTESEIKVGNINIDLNGFTITANKFTVETNAAGTMDIEGGNIELVTIANSIAEFTVNAPNLTVNQRADIYADNVSITVSPNTYNVFGNLVCRESLVIKGNSRLVRNTDSVVSAKTVDVQGAAKIETGSGSPVAKEDIESKISKVQSIEELSAEIKGSTENITVFLAAGNYEINTNKGVILAGTENGIYNDYVSNRTINIIGGGTERRAVTITKTVGVNGFGGGNGEDGGIFTVAGGNKSVENANITISNMTLNASPASGTAMAIKITQMKGGSFNVRNTDIVAAYSKGGRESAIFTQNNLDTVLNITGSNIIAPKYYAVYATGNKDEFMGIGNYMTININDSKLKGWSALYLSGINSALYAKDSEIIGDNPTKGEWFSTITYQGGLGETANTPEYTDENGVVQFYKLENEAVFDNCKVTSIVNNGAGQDIFATDGNSNITYRGILNIYFNGCDISSDREVTYSIKHSDVFVDAFKDGKSLLNEFSMYYNWGVGTAETLRNLPSATSALLLNDIDVSQETPEYISTLINSYIFLFFNGHSIILPDNMSEVVFKEITRPYFWTAEDFGGWITPLSLISINTPMFIYKDTATGEYKEAKFSFENEESNPLF